jgi:hypothetical protein
VTLETTVINPNSIHGEMKSRLNSGNSFYRVVQKLLSCLLLSEEEKIKMYKTIVLPVVLYGCETWFLMLMEDNSLRVLVNRVLRRMFGPNRDGMSGGWRRLHNEELHNLYSSPNTIAMIKSMRMRWAGHVARMGK